MAPAPALLPGKSHGWSSLVVCSPWGRWESDTTEWPHFHFSLSCIGEGNGNPLQCPCLENPRDRGAWWAAVYGVTQSWTWLRRLSSSSSSSSNNKTSRNLNSREDLRHILPDLRLNFVNSKDHNTSHVRNRHNCVCKAFSLCTVPGRHNTKWKQWRD